MDSGLPSKSRSNILVWVPISLVIISLTLLLVRAYRENHDWRTVYSDMLQKDGIISQMKTDLLRSVEAEKNAVLADTDEESRAFAQKSISAREAVNDNLGKLSQLINRDKFDDEKKGIQEFDKYWKELGKIDQRLLYFAVQNTNLKAARLSFTKAKEDLNKFESSLADIIGKESGSRGYHVAQLAYTAITEAFNIYSLQGPHIFATLDKDMDKIETSMTKSDHKVRQLLLALKGIVSPADSAELKTAETAFSEFQAINTEIVRLSRQNTNIRSIELSLGAKRKVTAECLETLDTLQQTVQSRDFNATR